MVICVLKPRTVCFYSCRLSSSPGTTGLVHLAEGQSGWTVLSGHGNDAFSLLRTWDQSWTEESAGCVGWPLGWGSEMLVKGDLGGKEVGHGALEGFPIIKGRKVLLFLFLKSKTIIKLLLTFTPLIASEWLVMLTPSGS